MASETPAAASPAPTAEPAAEPSNETQASVAKGSPPLGPRLLLLLVIPAIVVGVVSALGLLLATEIARAISDVFWTSIPTSIGIDGNGPIWIFLMLLLTGVAVGLVITFAPGHAGQDPATIELVSPPLPPMALPGLALAMILMLA